MSEAPGIPRIKEFVMSQDLLRRKYEHRFDLLDSDRDGYIEEEDFTELGSRVIRGLGEPVTSPKSHAVRESKAHYWRSVTELARVDGAGRISKQAFVAGLAESASPQQVTAMVRPAIEADLAIADRDNDGMVDVEEFKSLYQALGVPSTEAEEIFRELDRNADGELTLEEWLAAAIEFFTSTDHNAPGNRILGKA
ncbi:EF-hand domain-containing protein [Streptomyces sp. IBSNAI002]|uniref:EF-hand domain-containing protein n=1 Tax=Streptomyces sp. IBSNAI002 TaxID=3457500 RepID=UPI003FD37349